MTIIRGSHAPRQRRFSRQELLDHEIEAGSYFGLTDVTNQRGYGVFHFDGARAVQLGISSPDHRSSFTLAEGQTFRAAVTQFAERHGSHAIIHRMALPPGAYHPRVARPTDQHPTQSPGYCRDYLDLGDSVIASLSQMRSLVSMLNDIFQAVHPSGDNLNCYGSSIRSLILLASTECEAQWKGVLRANGYAASVNFTRRDYVKLSAPMKLPEYAVELTHYPWLGEQRPFDGWTPGSDGKAPLAWYDAYNAVKHDREANFAQATLSVAIQAVVACWVMIAAQFGFHGMREFEDLDRYFRLSVVPMWRFSEVYTHAYDGHFGSEGPAPLAL